MKSKFYNDQIKGLRELLKIQFVIIALFIMVGVVIFSLQTSDWLTAMKIGAVLFSITVLGALLIYSRAKQRIQLLIEITNYTPNQFEKSANHTLNNGDYDSSLDHSLLRSA